MNSNLSPLQEFKHYQDIALRIAESAEFDKQLFRLSEIYDEARFIWLVEHEFGIKPKQALEGVWAWGIVRKSRPLRELSLEVGSCCYPDIKRLIFKLIKVGLEHTLENDEVLRKLLPLPGHEQISEICRISKSNTPEAA